MVIGSERTFSNESYAEIVKVEDCCPILIRDVCPGVSANFPPPQSRQLWTWTEKTRDPKRKRNGNVGGRCCKRDGQVQTEREKEDIFDIPRMIVFF